MVVEARSGDRRAEMFSWTSKNFFCLQHKGCVAIVRCDNVCFCFFVFLYICFVSSALAAIEGVLPRCERGGELRKPSVRAAVDDERRSDVQAWAFAYEEL